MSEFIYRPYTLDTYFDKVFYINMDKDVQRNESMVAQFKKYGISNYERVPATVLKRLPAKALYRNFIKEDKKYIMGGLSCRASHVACISIASVREYSRVLILEDDVIFIQDPNSLLTQNQGILNSWDMLYFGGLVEPYYRSQVVCAHAYGLNKTLFDNIIYMAGSSGMEIDNFYAKVLQHMSYNGNKSGKYNICMIRPFNQVVQNKSFVSNIQQ